MDTRKKKGIAGRMAARWRTQLNFRSFFVTLGLLVWGLSLLGSAIMDNQARIFSRSV
ncbi:MAG: hypothetical protein MO853_08705 [Candidatus Protistobacter heckmanni]|nr:hypothetical protein [Candidatus Protistobacter heckmanni]